MIQRAIAWTAAVLVLAPAAAAQQDPGAIGEGAQVYSANCARCHTARSSTERTDAQWAVIVAHMRVRANLTRAQARAVLAYLQATNLPEGGGDRIGPEALVFHPDLAPVSTRLLTAAALPRERARGDPGRSR